MFDDVASDSPKFAEIIHFLLLFSFSFLSFGACFSSLRAMSDGGGDGDGDAGGGGGGAAAAKAPAKPMTNADFRALLAAPRPEAEAASKKKKKDGAGGQQRQNPQQQQQRSSRDGEGGFKYR